MLTDGRTHGRTDDGRKVIKIAHPEHSSGELKTADEQNSNGNDRLPSVENTADKQHL